MPMQSIIGLDHVVVLVRDLAEGQRRWEQLGFTVAPVGMHSASMGTANHTIMLGDDYIELIAVVADGVAKQTQLCVFEPKALAKGTVAAVPLPLQPYGFHGFWEVAPA